MMIERLFYFSHYDFLDLDSMFHTTHFSLFSINICFRTFLMTTNLTQRSARLTNFSPSPLTALSRRPLTRRYQIIWPRGSWPQEFSVYNVLNLNYVCLGIKQGRWTLMWTGVRDILGSPFKSIKCAESWSFFSPKNNCCSNTLQTSFQINPTCRVEIITLLLTKGENLQIQC